MHHPELRRGALLKAWTVKVELVLDAEPPRRLQTWPNAAELTKKRKIARVSGSGWALLLVLLNQLWWQHSHLPEAQVTAASSVKESLLSNWRNLVVSANSSEFCSRWDLAWVKAWVVFVLEEGTGRLTKIGAGWISMKRVVGWVLKPWVGFEALYFNLSCRWPVPDLDQAACLFLQCLSAPDSPPQAEFPLHVLR